MRFSYGVCSDAPPRTVFDRAVRYEDLQSVLPEYYVYVRVRSARGTVSVVEEHLRLGDRRLSLMAKHVAKFPIHDMFVIGGDLRGSRITERYLENGRGTEIAVDAYIRVGIIHRLTRPLEGRAMQGHLARMTMLLAKTASKSG